MIRKSVLAAAAAAFALSAPANAWGPTGHRVTASIAEKNVDGRTRAHIMSIIGTEPLAEASTWPDEERSNPATFWQETASPWHYVTLPEGRTVNQLVHPEEGDALTALERFTAVLRDPSASREDKALALRFIVHLVPDLHMPLHAGNGEDRGGNWFNVTWFDEPQNLHWVWDEGLLLRQQLSYTEYTARLERRITPDLTLQWWDPRPNTWVAESVELRDRIYPETGGELGDGSREFPVALSYDYQWKWHGTAEQRLSQAGIRLAAYLDMVFAEIEAPAS